MSERSQRLRTFFGPLAKRHRRLLFAGFAGAAVMVGLRIALPYPLAHFAGPWLEARQEPDAAGSSTNALLLAGGLFALLYITLGVFDFLSRLWFARFAIESIADVRRTHGLAGWEARREKKRGDYLARVVGDTARLKEGVRGFLIHVATNGLLFIGIVVALFFVHRTVAAVMALALFLTGVVTVLASRRIRKKAKRLRRREGLLANSIRASARRSKLRVAAKGSVHVRPSKGFHRASLTRMQGRAAWLVTSIMGLAIAVSLWLVTLSGSGEATFVFVSYALMLVHPVVRLSRQGTRTGKIVACASRVERALSKGLSYQAAPESPL